MKSIKRVICLVLTIMLVLSLCACGSNSNSTNTKEETEEERVRAVLDAVLNESKDKSWSIGGNKAYANITITNVRKVSDTEYIVSGEIVLTETYGAKWKNTFDCKVYRSYDGSCSVAPFEYSSKGWTKG